ncbi:MAG TPA: DUF397 domain-containing protein [Candidatus Saccharimonadales bacterium]|nr:DUF397 domain-containing protein [Candidatus Saccharimonadales bacterium]
MKERIGTDSGQDKPSNPGLVDWAAARKSSYCDGGACVEVVFGEGAVGFQDTTQMCQPDRTRLVFANQAAEALLAEIKAGLYDF